MSAGRWADKCMKLRQHWNTHTHAHKHCCMYTRTYTRLPIYIPAHKHIFRSSKCANRSPRHCNSFHCLTSCNYIGELQIYACVFVYVCIGSGSRIFVNINALALHVFALFALFAFSLLFLWNSLLVSEHFNPVFLPYLLLFCRIVVVFVHFCTTMSYHHTFRFFFRFAG